MNDGKICVSVCGETAGEALEQIEFADKVADIVEIRFDYLAPEEIKPLIGRLTSVDTQLLATFRPREQGGRRDITLVERLEFWNLLLEELDRPDLLVDHETDIASRIAFDENRRIVSNHDFDGVTLDLDSKFAELSDLPANTIKIAVDTRRVTDAIRIWNLLPRAKAIGKNLVPIAMGEAGKWTRILSLAHGASMTYASNEGTAGTAPGQIPSSDLRDIFRVKDLDKDTGVYGIIAGDTSYSLSPYIHNPAFKRAGINSVFVPLQTDDVGEFLRRMVRRETREVELNFRGFSVTNPHKLAIIDHLDHVDETSRTIGAVNTVKIEAYKLYGYNTDARGFIEPLRKVVGDLRDLRVAVAGAGGAARACVYALQGEGADVTVLARDPSRAARLTEDFGVRIAQLANDHRALTSFDILVNTTPLGTKGANIDETVATSDELRHLRLVYDLVYNPSETRLLREAKAAGVATLGGLEMLVAQAAQQFKIWTGKNAPLDVMKAAGNRAIEVNEWLKH